MGVPEFYLNALEKHRRETLEFMLTMRQYVLQKKIPPAYEHHHSLLPPKYSPNFSADIGDAILFSALQFNQQRDFTNEINAMAKMLQSEQLTEVPSIRDHVLRLANEYILCSQLIPLAEKQSTSHLGFREYLLFFVNQYCEGRNIPKATADKMREAVTSPVMNQLRKLMEYYAMPLNHQKEAKSFIQFYACICVLLMRMDDLQLNEYLFQVLGEAENVFFKYEDSFPGYINLDNFAKFGKLLLNGKVQQMGD